jgi:hypothetical protein
MRPEFDVEIFPIAPERWIAVIDTPDGPFSTEADSAAGVVEAVRQAILEVSGHADPLLRLLDEERQLWSIDSAGQQLHDLGATDC